MLFEAELVAGQQRQPAIVRDLSQNGVMLTGDDLPAVGQRVVVALGAAKLFGTIVWNQDGYCGLSLHTPIEPLRVVRDMTRGQALNAVRPGPLAV